jgi:23S rRNA (uracil1939-C5)-methyltransferase
VRTARPDRAAEVTIARLGFRGDGIAETDAGPVFVPNALPGERALVRLGKPRADGFAGRVVERHSSSPHRAEPPCPHFGACGGCAVQHLDDAGYREWKLGLLIDPLERRGLPTDVVGDLVCCPPERRRLRFAAVGRQSGAVLGFNARASNQIVDLETCVVAAPAIRAMLGPLRTLLGELLGPKRSCDAELLAAENGLDLLLVGGINLNARRRMALVDFAGKHGIARLSVQQGERAEPEVIVQFDAPEIRFGSVPVHPPPGAFLQPSRAGEEALRHAVQEMIPPGTLRIAELYAGCGAFGLPLAGAGFRVAAFEGDAAMVRALTQAAGRASLGGRISGHVRDLARQPLMGSDLSGSDLVLLDPPRSGAAVQIERLAERAVPAVIYVSCNPASFIRDAAILVEGGYDLVHITPVDQFAYTPHLELVALFLRSG